MGSMFRKPGNLAVILMPRIEEITKAINQRSLISSLEANSRSQKRKTNLRWKIVVEREINESGEHIMRIKSVDTNSFRNPRNVQS
jgi:hypothetical protein